MRQQARNHLHALKRWTVVSNVQERWDTVMADLDAPITSLDREIAALLRDSAWAEAATLLLFIPGGGIQTTAWLLVAMLNFTTCETADSLPAYGGLTPHSMNRGVACGNGHE
jgi:hypothetical protein